MNNNNDLKEADMELFESGRMGTDRYEGINYERMREYRRERTRQFMKDYNIGTLISFDAWDIRYITGHYVTIPVRWFESQYVVFPVNGDPYGFYQTSFSEFAARDEMPWMKDKIWTNHNTMLKLASTVEEIEPLVMSIVDIIAEHGLTDQTVRIDGTGRGMLLAEAFKRKGFKVMDAAPMMFHVRKIKCKEEIECVRQACMMAEAAFYDIKQNIHPGIRENELLGIGMNRLYAQGADECQEFVVASGPRTNPLHIDFTDRQIRPGDMVIVDVNGNSFQGYKSCYYRTFKCGKATQEEKEKYEECRALVYGAIDLMKAGATTEEVVQAWPDSPKYWGYDTWQQVGGCAVAHGIGISLHEYPFFKRAAVEAGKIETLEEGMTIAVEVFTGDRDGKFGIRIEEDVLVTKDGAELLTKWPVDEITECPF